MDNVVFDFPGSPYEVQKNFMRKAYSAMISGGLCVLESPTGTGKSLSLLCSALAWLRDFRQQVIFERLSASMTGSDDIEIPTWINDGNQRANMEEAVSVVLDWKAEKLVNRATVSKFGIYNSEGRIIAGPNKRKPAPSSESSFADDDDLVVEDATVDSAIPATQNVADPKRRVQVIICSRTHSQLSQLLKEVKRIELHESFNIILMGSRSQLCVNSNVDTSRPAMSVNDACIKLTDSSSCRFRNSLEPLTKLLLSRPLDIEDACIAGRDTQTYGCPYFASRLALRDADIVFVPYASILHTKTRESLGIKVDDNIIIIDEAHNISEAVNSVRSTSFSVVEIESLTKCLSMYLDTFRSRLSPRNFVAIKSLDFLVRRLNSFIRASESTGCSVSDFLAESRLVDIDLANVTRFLDDFQFSRKLKGFSEKYDIAHPNSVYALAAFLQALQCSSSSDRIIVTEDSSSFKCIRFASIDCESELAKLVRTSRAVLFVGGTMQPFSEHKAVAALGNVQFSTFSGSSVIERDRIFCRIVTKSTEATGPIAFDRARRDTDACMNMLREVLTTVCACVSSGGVIVFASSYEYARRIEKLVASIFVQHGVFCDAAGSKDRIFAEYVKRIRTAGSAVLIAVVNGSLSEGIDFKDDLCRCVVLVGLPYPNATDPLVRERMTFLDIQHRSNPGFLTGDQYYQGRCIKAVNQSIGRALRHSRDWASIILLDARFCRPATLAGLPEWIREAAKECVDQSELRTDMRIFHKKWTDN